jgi:hypothetical protein
VDRNSVVARSREQADNARAAASTVYYKGRQKVLTQLQARRARQRALAAISGGTGAAPAPAARLLPGADNADAQRLVPSPVFVLSATRSGSTLVRMVLDSHSQICAPHEMHLRQVKVDLSHPNAKIGMEACGLSERDLENLLWDRVLHLMLARSGKSVIVDKTPHNVRNWQRILDYWPEARYIFLLRHPVAVADSMHRAWPSEPKSQHYEVTTGFARNLAAARAALPGLTVRYEDFVADPATGSQEICEFVGVPWEESMLRYTEQSQGKYRSRLGDWSQTIRSGVIRPPQPLPDHVPDELREACDLLGY